MSILTALNPSPQSPITLPISPKITINVLPGTDLWRKPPSINSTNAPAYVEYRPIKSFKRAQVTVKSDWSRLYDQGGLVFLVNSPGLDEERYESWVKTGIELFDGKPNVGTVATPAGGYADWSLVPLQAGTSATIEVTPEKGGSTLYVHLLDGERKTLIREVTWVFQGKHDLLLGVGVYAARPTKLEGEATLKGESLAVHFEGLEIEWNDQ
ncbi:hypothetical protein CTheo_3216 [Ceratobasidium theobromae]|uniref:Uncharacterized protein n=1 Tax=Ceratobasidium theobromae TaxID=1582974 RepID=A0A5N5QNX1_9AGAM|nr:hypothetical protein CTheo_3216 [Ceratobasidium theobromae]